jgi:biotin transport system substrate-specific component
MSFSYVFSLARSFFVSTPSTKVHKILLVFALSLIYFISSQIIIPLPFNLVPLSLQPIPFIFCVEFFGWAAVQAYGVYLVQGALGAPCFSRFGGGLLHLLGPTGGYLWGFLLAMIFVAVTRRKSVSTITFFFARYWLATIIIFACGLMQLACFVAPSKLLMAGFYPFIVGDFIVKPIMLMLLQCRYKWQKSI